MSSSGKYVWIGAPPNNIYPRDLSSKKTFTQFSGSHVAIGIDSSGREVLVGVGTRYDGSKYMGSWTLMVDIETGEQFWLTPWCVGQWHVDASDLEKPGWAVFSVYTPEYPTVESSWGDHEVFMVELTRRTNPPASLWRLAHTHTVKKAYSDDPFGKINRKGTKVWFGTGWGISINDAGSQYDAYQIDLPSTWYQDLMGNMPPTASISATPLSGKPPLTVNFTGSGKDIDGTVVSYTWDFGDGSTSNQQNTSHTFETPGNYTATLKVIDDKGLSGNAYMTINVLKSDITSPHKFITAYDFNETDISFIASHFDLIETYLEKSSQVQQMKELNPNLKAIYYRDPLAYWGTNDWYVRDAQTGAKLIQKDWNWPLGDVSNPLYRAYVRDAVKYDLDNYPVFDGVFLDDYWQAISPTNFYREGTTELGTVPQTVIDSWLVNMTLLLSEIRTAIGNKLIIVNTGPYAIKYLGIADGQMYEAFCHANWQTFTDYYGDWQEILNRMITLNSSGKIYLAQSGIQKDATESQTIKTAKYCFSMFLLGANSNSYFYFSTNYRGVTYFPEWVVDIGTPVEDYYSRSGTPLYEREYSKGLVLINPSSESAQINLESNYKNLDGVITNIVVLGSREGAILQKVWDTNPPAHPNNLKIVTSP